MAFSMRNPTCVTTERHPWKDLVEPLQFLALVTSLVAAAWCCGQRVTGPGPGTLDVILKSPPHWASQLQAMKRG